MEIPATNQDVFIQRLIAQILRLVISSMPYSTHTI